ncbi:MAG: HAD-IC family P-type ATPase [Rhabdochlamydiaceae bacterium]
MGPVGFIITISMSIAFIQREWLEFYILSALFTINLCICFYHVYSSYQLIESLQKKMQFFALVKRNDEWKSMSLSDLKQNDILHLKIGDVVHYEMKILSVNDLKTKYEGSNREKYSQDRLNIGETIVQGDCIAEILSLDNSLQNKEIKEILEKENFLGFFDKKLIKFGRYITCLSILILLVFNIFLFGKQKVYLDHLHLFLALLITIIPVALSSVISLTFSIGVKKLADQGVILRNIDAIQSLACMDILCSDKTGTLTKNQMVLKDLWNYKGFNKEDLHKYALLGSDLEHADPIDLAIKKSCDLTLLNKDYKVVSFKPHSPSVKRSESVVVLNEKKQFLVSKGSLPAILPLCGLTESEQKKCYEKADEFAHQGWRSIAIAKKTDKENFELVGLMGLEDPLREDSNFIIRGLQSLGIQIKMLTGDQNGIAKKVGVDLGIGHEIVETKTITGSSDKFFIGQKIEALNGLSQVLPKDKLLAVESLQERQHIVMVTGDGVNDIEALKRADIGICVVNGVDGAKLASDFVLLKEGLSPLLNLVQHSRSIFEKIKNYALYRLSDSLRFLTFFIASFLIFNFFPLSPVALLMIVIVNELAIFSMIFDNVDVPLKPAKWDTLRLVSFASFLAFFDTLLTLLLVYIYQNLLNVSIDTLLSIIYLRMSISGHSFILSIRDQNKHFFQSKYLLITILMTQFLSTLIVVYGFYFSAISWWTALCVWAYSIAGFLIVYSLQKLKRKFFISIRSNF